MQLGTILLTNLLAISIAMGILWIVATWLRDLSIVDIFWGLGFVFVTWLSLLMAKQTLLSDWLLVTIVTLWGLRLAGYLAWRNLGKPEDYRYRAMRERNGRGFAVVSLFTVFGLQGLLLWIISLPLQVGATRAQSWHVGMAIGVAFWAIGLFFETTGDLQLARFKANPANRDQVMNRGLWQYTRHPNYFGDFLVWWGIYFVTVERSSWWWTIISPLLMSFLLVRVSGVRLLEDSLKHRVAGYEEYVRTTSSFFPLPPKKSF